MAFHTRRVDFLHKRIVHKKFQLKIPTLSKNDCSATWKPNTYQKYDTCGKVRNVQRYQKYVVILRSFIFIVSDIFKPTVISNSSNFSLKNIVRFRKAALGTYNVLRGWKISLKGCSPLNLRFLGGVVHSLHFRVLNLCLGSWLY